MSLSQSQRILIRFDQQKVGDPVTEIEPGANDDSSRELLTADPLLIVFVNFTTGDDATGDGSSGNPFKTYAKGVAEVGSSSKTHVEWQTNDTISEEITVPTQASIGVIGDFDFTGLNLDIWTQASTPSFAGSIVLGVATDSSGNWVAVAISGKIAFSSDNGDTWTQASVPSFGGSNVRRVATDSSGNWVAVGDSGKIALSVDNGDNWTQASTPSFGATNVLDVATDSLGNWVAVGTGGKIAFSTDNGDTWTQASTPSFAGTEVQGVATDSSGNWVAVAQSGKIAFSTDNGDTWTQASTPSFGADEINSVATDSAGNWVAVANSGKIAFSSDNGDTWTQASTSSFGGGDAIEDVTTDSNGIWIAVGSVGKIAFSTDNGDNWTQSSTPGFGADQVFGVTTDSAGNWVAVGDNGKIGFLSSNNTNITADFCGFSSTTLFRLSTSNLNILQCSVAPSTGKALTSSTSVNVDKCKITSTDNTAIDIAAIVCSVTNTIANATTDTFFPLEITGAALSDADIDVEFCTLIGDVSMDNTGGTGLELMQNCIIQGDFTATSTTLMTLERCNVFNGAVIGANTFQSIFVDPLLLSDNRLQRITGYTDLVGRFDFDSPLKGKALDFVNATIDHETANPQARDLGAFSFNDAGVFLDFLQGDYIPISGADSPLVEIKTNKAIPHQTQSGSVEVANDIDRQTESIVIKYINIRRRFVNIIDRIEALRDTTVYLAIAPDTVIDLPDLAADGAHAAGVFSVKISVAQIFSGTFVTIAGKDYNVLYVSPIATAATDIILDRALEDAILDAAVITQSFPTGTGIFTYVPRQTRSLTRTVLADEEHLRGLTLTFIRKCQ